MGKSTEPLKTRQYATAETLTRRLQSRAGRATRILLYISALGIFRVAKYITLKSAKWLLFSDLQVTQKCRRLEQNLTSGCIAPMSARTTLLQMPELLFLLLPC